MTHEPDSHATCALLDRLSRGDRGALEPLLDGVRPGLVAFVDLHLDGRLRARLDPSDVVQETLLHVSRRMSDYLKRRPMPFRLWVRKTGYERLVDLRRRERRQRRAPEREVALPPRSSLLLVRPLLPSPSQQLAAREFADKVAQAVGELSEADQEILLMRHGEEMPFDEIACLLEIDAAAARKRFGRALIRLQKVLGDQGIL